MWPLRDVGPLTDEYSMTSDWDNQWLTGGLEPDVIAEAHLDPPSIFAGIQRFARERESASRGRKIWSDVCRAYCLPPTEIGQFPLYGGQFGTGASGAG